MSAGEPFKLRWYHYFESWLFWVNFLFFQWFFIRLQQTIDTTTGKTIKWDFLRYPVPLTGWFTNYKFWPKHVYRKKNPIKVDYDGKQVENGH